jgi:diacylglycerol kinase
MNKTTRWGKKFRDAFRGLRSGSRGQSSFVVHIPAAIAVLATAAVLHCELWEWIVLLICITMVLTAEWFNSALELFARAAFKEHNDLVGQALDSASAAVLIASLGAAIIGSLIFIVRIAAFFA